MPRKVEDWIGKTDDAKIPPRVRLRVFEREFGLCYCCGMKIMPGDKWELDHIVPAILGGLHSEGNLAPMLAEHHKIKTKQDVATKSKVYRTKAKHLGIKRHKSRPIPGSKGSGVRRKMDGTVWKE